ncbi:MAG: hypothetical protein C0594_11495 [Marinilabiliales bacterium]|nr:MAG: hypothetical protein C0594_11495 [Marinilabiliales bacterium]
MNTVFKLVGDFFSLIYPKYCSICGNSLYKNEQIVCLKCQLDFPRTRFHDDVENPVFQLFWGRVHLNMATAYCNFNKDGNFRKLIHQLKYKGRKDVGRFLGSLLGNELIKSEFFESVDCIVPVPLHPKREKQRGYNQSEWIAMGLSESMNKKYDAKNLYRSVANDTQTKKGRIERWENVEDIFKLRNPELFKDKHLLLVDDVVTTGSTLEACASTLLRAEGAKVSIACLGVAKQ